MRRCLCVVLPVALLFGQANAAESCKTLAESYLDNQFLAKGCDIGWQTEGEAHDSHYDNAWFSSSNIDIFCTTMTDDCRLGGNTEASVSSAKCQGDVVTEIEVRSAGGSSIKVTPAYGDGQKKKHGSYTMTSSNYKPSVCHGDFVINPNL